MVICSEGTVLDRKKYRERKIAKVRKIGVLGALNGIRMRRWYNADVCRSLNLQDLSTVARGLDLRFETTSAINTDRTIELFREANADLGLSLGNLYIGEGLFGVPKYGMINVHHEVLPEFRGAQSVIWQIYEGSSETGYSIHQIDNHTDTGKILYQEKITIELKPTLRQTVSHNYGRLYEASAKGLVKVLKNYPNFTANAKAQSAGASSYTTPTFAQYLRITRQHRRLYNDYKNSLVRVSNV